MFKNLVNCPIEFNKSSGDTSTYTIGRHGFTNNSTGCNCCSSANHYSRKKGNIATDPYIFLNNYILIISFGFICFSYISNKCSYASCMIASLDV